MLSSHSATGLCFPQTSWAKKIFYIGDGLKAIDYDENADGGGGEDGNGTEQGRENGRGTGRRADGLIQQPRDSPSPELTRRANTTNPLCRQMSTNLQ